RYLVLALALAIVGQLTTTLMYFANAMSLAAQHVRASEVLFASAVMTFGTFVAPSASGEGVRELVFVWLLGSRAGAAKAFLVGYLVLGWTRRSAGDPEYVTAPADRGPITPSVAATGTVNPVTTVQVGTYVSGPIQAIYADFNTPVRRGQLLARIDPRPFQVKV